MTWPKGEIRSVGVESNLGAIRVRWAVGAAEQPIACTTHGLTDCLAPLHWIRRGSIGCDCHRRINRFRPFRIHGGVIWTWQTNRPHLPLSIIRLLGGGLAGLGTVQAIARQCCDMSGICAVAVGCSLGWGSGGGHLV